VPSRSASASAGCATGLSSQSSSSSSVEPTRTELPQIPKQPGSVDVNGSS
jgi:hypothetical protein